MSNRELREVSDMESRSTEERIGDAILARLADPPRLTADAFLARVRAIIDSDPGVIDRLKWKHGEEPVERFFDV